MYTKTRSKRFAPALRGRALAVSMAGIAACAMAVPALAQDSVTTTRTTTYYSDAPTITTTYYAGPTYYAPGYAYDYPPAPAYTYAVPAPPPPPVAGVSVGVPGFGIQLGF